MPIDSAASRRGTSTVIRAASRMTIAEAGARRSEFDRRSNGRRHLLAVDRLEAELRKEPLGGSREKKDGASRHMLWPGATPHQSADGRVACPARRFALTRPQEHGPYVARRRRRSATASLEQARESRAGPARSRIRSWLRSLRSRRTACSTCQGVSMHVQLSERPLKLLPVLVVAGSCCNASTAPSTTASNHGIQRSRQPGSASTRRRGGRPPARSCAGTRGAETRSVGAGQGCRGCGRRTPRCCREAPGSVAGSCRPAP